jgi:hypothetical protein
MVLILPNLSQAGIMVPVFEIMASAQNREIGITFQTDIPRTI